MPVPKGVRYGGRQKGTPNKRKVNAVELAKQLLESGESPLEFFIAKMREPLPKKIKGESADGYARRCDAHEAMRFEAAKAAAPFVHPKQQAITVSDPNGGAIPIHATVVFGGPPK